MSEITAEIKKVEKLLCSDGLQIPAYQRPYRWQEKNVLLLLEDVFASWKNLKSAYRIGSVILHEEDNQSETKQLDIVDGQQRITTLVLILLQLDADYASGLANKLKFNHSDSEKNIKSNYRFIGEWIEENIRNEKETFLKYISNYCEFVEVRVSNLSEAFQMFDSQNSRGKSLESYNLLKAFHIRAMEDNSEKERIDCDRRWENATRFAKETIDSVAPKDVLRQLFNEQLYRTRKWSRKEAAFRFSNAKLNEFKGITLSNRTTVEHPYQNTSVLQAVALNYFSGLNVEVKGMKSRFNNKNLENVNSFTTINQAIINGKAFFDFIETYVEIYKQLFLFSSEDGLSDFKEFYLVNCNYKNSGRTGDKYLKELYKSLVMIMFDKYGEDGLNKYYRTLYALVYRMRLEKNQVRYAAVAKYPSDNQLFSIISQSKTFFDLRKLNELARQPIECQKDVEVIIVELLSQQIPIESVNKDIDMDKYKAKL